VHKLVDEKGRSRFKYICEGANLFFTQDARMVLEDAGAILFKDASTNKGGVTSSSLEVLAALAMDGDDFDVHMSVKDINNPPEFYQEYVKEICDILESAADKEFACLWKEHKRTGMHRFLLTDKLSDKINDLTNLVNASNLYDDPKLRVHVLRQVIPQRLQEMSGLEQILENLPDNYSRALFSMYLASNYIYQYGIDANEFAFFEYMQPMVLEANK
jgi:glutamate dehydrogenase